LAFIKVAGDLVVVYVLAPIGDVNDVALAAVADVLVVVDTSPF